MKPEQIIGGAAVAMIEAAGYAIVPIVPTEPMLDELARIGDGPLISGAEVWGYMLAAAISTSNQTEKP